MIRMNMIAPLTILLVSSCVNIKPRPLADISFDFNRCRIRCYDYNEFKIIKDHKCNKKENGETVYFHSGNYPVEKCEGLTGAFTKDLAKEILPKVKKNKQHCEDIEQ